MDGPTRCTISEDRFRLGPLAPLMIRKTRWSDRKYGCSKFQVASDDYKERLRGRITRKNYIFDGTDEGSMQKAKGLVLEDK